jgi:hypothetical protein
MALTDYYNLIAQLAQDSSSRITPDDTDRALAAAVLRYGRDRPRRQVEDVTLAMGGYFADLPELWEEGFSELQQVEYPIGARPPAILAASESWDMYETPDGQVLAFVDSLPEGATLRLTYTRQHQVDGSADTIPEQDREAVCCWAAALLCDQLASWYAANGDPTIQADRVDQTSPQKAYASRAEKLRKRYLDEIGVEEKRNVAAGVVVSHADRNSLGGPRITHPLRPWTGRR